MIRDNHGTPTGPRSSLRQKSSLYSRISDTGILNSTSAFLDNDNYDLRKSPPMRNRRENTERDNDASKKARYSPYPESGTHWKVEVVFTRRMQLSNPIDNLQGTPSNCILLRTPTQS